MKYYSTNHRAPEVSLAEAVKKGLAPDKGLYMPERIGRLPEEFFGNIADMDFHRIATAVAEKFFGEDIPSEDLKKIVCDTLNFDTPIVNVHDRIWSLELFHGPTLAFKDVGGRFMARMLSYFIERGGQRLPRSGRHRCDRPLSGRESERDPGKAVHYTREEHHSPGSRRKLR